MSNPKIFAKAKKVAQTNKEIPLTGSTTTSLNSPESPPRPKRGRRPKAKGMPNRPLSAYNLFFKEERQNILKDIQEGTPRADYLANAEATKKSSNGNLGPAKFQAIARTIASRWKALGEGERKRFEAQAVKEMDAYKIKKAEYNRKVALEAETVASNEGDSLNESRSTTKASLTHASQKPAPQPNSDSLLGKTVPLATASMKAPGMLNMASSLGMESAFFQTSHVFPSSHRNAALLAGAPSTFGQYPGLHEGMPHSASSLWQSHDNQANLRLALQIEELRRREQALALAEQLQRERQILHQHQLMQAHLALQQQHQTHQGASNQFPGGLPPPSTHPFDPRNNL